MSKRWLVVLLILVSLGSGAYFIRGHSRGSFAWLVFGPVPNCRILMRVEGDAVSLDLDQDGKFDSAGEQSQRFEACKNMVIKDADGRTSYVITGIQKYRDEHRGEERFMIDVDIKGDVEYRQYADVGTSHIRHDAPIAHFHGPLTVEAQTIGGKLPPDLRLLRGEKPADLRAWVGTIDLGKGCWVVVRSHKGLKESAFPTNVFPMVEVAFPSKKAGDPPITAQYPLSKFC